MNNPSRDAKNASQGEMLLNRLKKRSRHLKKWARRTGTEAWRLYDRDIPEIPLLIDIYGDSIAGALYQRPYEKDPAEEEQWLSYMTNVISEALEIPGDRIFIKQREHKLGNEQYQKAENRNFIRDIHEGGLCFRVNLSDYLDTGIFLDHRKTRDLVRSEARGKKVLNLFCYTAAFSVYAASGGAASVDSVDISNTYLDWAAVNFALNGFTPQKLNPWELASAPGQASPFTLIRGDVLRFIDEAAGQKPLWDYIILDPPTFSNSKKMEDTLDIRRDYRELIRKCLGLLKSPGTLLFSTNAKGFKLDADAFPGTRMRDIQAETVDEDFKGRKTRFCCMFYT